MESREMMWRTKEELSTMGSRGVDKLLDQVWPKIQLALDRSIANEPLDLDTYLGAYNAYYHFQFCLPEYKPTHTKLVDHTHTHSYDPEMSQGGCGKLYRRLTSYLREKASTIYEMVKAETQDESLVSIYDKQQKLWIAAAKKNSHMLALFDSRQIQPELERLEDLRSKAAFSGVVVFTEPFPDNSGIDLHQIGFLHLKVWEQVILEPLRERLEACAKTASKGAGEGTGRYSLEEMVLELRKPKQA